MCPTAIAPRRAGDLPTVYACPDKSARILGWRADYSLEDMCRDSWRWQTQNPKRLRNCLTDNRFAGSELPAIRDSACAACGRRIFAA